MEVIIFQEEYVAEPSIDNFLELLYSGRMNYLASDLLNEGFSPLEIWNSVQRAMTVAKKTGIDIREHFSQVYTQSSDGLIRDCKLTRFGYALVMLNGPAKVPAVGRWQLRVLRSFI